MGNSQQLDFFTNLYTTKTTEVAGVAEVVNDTEIRRALVDGKVYFSIIDIIRYLLKYNSSVEAKKYWFNVKLKIAKDEPHFQLSHFSRQLKLLAEDGRRRETECFCLQDILRIIMSIPSESYFLFI